MKRTRHTPEQIIRKLKTVDQLIARGKAVIEVCRVLEVAQPTCHRWWQLYGGMQAEEAKRLTQLEKENARLKKLLTWSPEIAPGWTRKPSPARLGRVQLTRWSPWLT
jgi:putative transposase